MNTVKRESKHNLSSVASAKKIKRNFENPLDKPTNLWYNKYVSERDKESPLNKSLVLLKGFRIW
jgi:hypothetical protein